MMIFPLLLLALSSSTRGAPAPNLSINAQVPPVARVDHPYNFLFSTSTFTSTTAISYALTNAPGWLQLDSPSRTLSGTPGMQDSGSISFDLVATDQTGSTPMNVTFVVMVPPGPGLGTPVATQLAAYGPFSIPDGLLLTPSSSLSLSFSPDTFTNINQNTVYYALSADNTPLPSWIQFDPASFTFSGITPQATSPSALSQTYGIQLTASDVVGFAGAIATFQLTIEGHLFAFGNKSQVINITNGFPVNYTGIWSNLYLDGQIINSADIGQVVADAPSWLSLDQDSLALYGTPPPGVATQNITVTATDSWGDNTSTIIQIQTAGTASAAAGNSGATLISPFPTLSATIGADFAYDFNNTLSSVQGVNVTVDPGTASGWLAFNSSGLDIQGHVPSNLKPQSVQVDITASLGNQTQSQVLTINVASSISASSHTTSSASSTSITSEGPTAKPASRSTPRKGWIAAAVIVPLAVVLGVILLLCCCCRRKWRLKLKFKIKSSEEKKEEKKRKIRRLKVEEENQDEPKTPLVMTGALDGDQEQESKAPRIHIPGLWKSGANKRSSNIRHSKATTSSTAQSRKSDPWQKYVGGLESSRILPPFAAVPASDKTSGEHSPARAGATDRDLEAGSIEGPSFIIDPLPARKLSKQRKTGSRHSFGSSAKFSSLRVSGLGHGRNAMSQGSGSLLIGNRGVGHGDGQMFGGPPGYGVVTKSWRNFSLKRRGSLDSSRRGSWDSTTSASNSNDPIYVEGPHGPERPSTQNNLGSRMPNFPRPPTSSTFDQFKTPNIIHEVSDDDEPRKNLWPVKALPRSHRGAFPTRQRSITDPERLQAFHKLRRQKNTSSPLFSGGEISSARKYSLHNRVSPKSSSNGDIKSESSNPRKQKIRRSYSQSSSLEPRKNLSSPRSSNSVSGSPPRRKGSLLHNFTVRALSLSSRGHDSVSSDTSSRFESAASIQLERDENGDRRWRYADHPNPLTMNRASRIDANGQELIDSLRNSGNLGAAHRQTYLKAHTEGSGLGTIDKEGNVELRSSRGKKMVESMGLRREDTGLKSLRGDIGDAGVGSAFV